MTPIQEEIVEYLAQGAKNAAGVLTPAKRLFSPHGLYSYPARFSPHFAGRAIEVVSKPGDTVLDPFMGSGTTLIEAVKLGRSSLGVDISPISHFLTDRIFRGTSYSELQRAQSLSTKLIDYLREKGPARLLVDEDLLRSINLFHEDTIEIGSALYFWIQEAKSEGKEAGRLLRAFALSAGQWALDGKRQIPSYTDFLNRIELIKNVYPVTIHSFGQACQERWGTKSWHHHVKRKFGDSREILTDLGAEGEKFDAMVTSPPYPGVHMLYGKWQIQGRRETRAPQWIVGSKELTPDSRFTMGPRRSSEDLYFHGMSELYRAAHGQLKSGSISVHMVGFKNPSTQLPKYIEMMASVGFDELSLTGPQTSEGRIWRRVPSRKFYAQSNAASDSTSNEVVLMFETR